MRHESIQCHEIILAGLGQLGTKLFLLASLDGFLCDAWSTDTAVADLSIVGLIDFGPYTSSTLLKTLEFCNPHSDTTSDEVFFE